MGHVAWTCQNASGNRGDDLRALKQCDLQPYKILHPNMETIIPTILGLQDEHKATKSGMQTVSLVAKPGAPLLHDSTDRQSNLYGVHRTSQPRDVSNGCYRHLPSLAP
jgi:hypothetical protein